MKPTLVFLHYFSGAAESWRYVIELLEPSYQCVALDLPGFGRCPMVVSPSIDVYSRWVLQQLKSQGIHQAILVGHSMGGKVAVDIAASQAAERIDGRCKILALALIAPSPATREPMEDSKKDQLESTHPDEQAAAEMVDDSTAKPLSAERMRLAVKTNLQSNETAWRWWLRDGMEQSIASRVRPIQIPVNVLGSRQDPVIPIDVIQSDVIDLIQPSTLTKVNGVGHLMPLENEKMVADWIEHQCKLVPDLQRETDRVFH